MNKIPKVVFIVPYRNRIQQKFFFEQYMSFLLENRDDYEIYFSHQNDARPFNRGACKNIGFIAVKNKYPNHYRDINFVFNDVDTMPFNKIFSYETQQGVVAHYYGFRNLLGGIVVLKGSDFELINGYPNYWSWGNEDNILQTRVLNAGLVINRSHFYTIGSPQILQLFDGISRIINKRDFMRMKQDNGSNGITNIIQLNYTIDKKSNNHNDNIHRVLNNTDKRFVININHFIIPGSNPNEEEFYNYDLREPAKKITVPDNWKKTNSLVQTTDDWKNIPVYRPLNQNKNKHHHHHHNNIGSLKFT